MKKTYYCVSTEFYDDGAVKAAITSSIREEKPQSTYRELSKMDAYKDWFDTKAEAEEFLAKAKAA